MSKEGLNVGIIGTGNIANEHLVPALKLVPGAVFWAASGMDYQKALDFAERHEARSEYKARMFWQDMLDDPELDAVIIATPDRWHCDMAVRAIEKGKHVFIEKPMVLDLCEIKYLKKALERNPDIKLAVGYHHRWHDGHRDLRKYIAMGDYGDIKLMRMLWMTENEYSGWRSDNENPEAPYALGALGTHLIDLAIFLLELACGSVMIATGNLNKTKSGKDTAGGVCLQFESGALVEIGFMVGSPKAVKHFEIYGTQGNIVADNTLGARGSGFITHIEGVQKHELSFVDVNPYAKELRDFINSIGEDRQPQTGCAVGALNTEIMHAIFKKGAWSRQN